jgi:hypothetical protein
MEISYEKISERKLKKLTVGNEYITHTIWGFRPKINTLWHPMMLCMVYLSLVALTLRRRVYVGS